MKFRVDKTFVVGVILAVCGFVVMAIGNALSGVNSQVGGQLPEEAGGAASGGGKVERIVSITPLGTELIYALGCGDRVVGVDLFSDYPPEVADVVKVGSFFDTNFEAITALKPDLVVTLGESLQISNYCKDNNIRQLHLKLSDLGCVYEEILLTAKILGCEKRGLELSREIFDGLTSIRQRLVDRSGDAIAREKVFLCLGRKPGGINNLSTTGSNTCFTEMIELAGGKNIFDDLEVPYADISRESLITRAPDVIIEAVDPKLLGSDSEKLIGQWQVLEVPAVTNGRVYLIDANLLHRPGARMVEIAEELYRCINGVEKIKEF